MTALFVPAEITTYCFYPVGGLGMRMRRGLEQGPSLRLATSARGGTPLRPPFPSGRGRP